MRYYFGLYLGLLLCTVCGCVFVCWSLGLLGLVFCVPVDLVLRVTGCYYDGCMFGLVASGLLVLMLLRVIAGV